MPDPRDRVEISSVGPSLTVEGRTIGVNPSQTGGAQHSVDGGGKKPYLRIWFQCSKQYARAYQDKAGQAYHARCPSCGKTIRFAIGPGGSSKRFFEVSC